MLAPFRTVWVKKRKCIKVELVVRTQIRGKGLEGGEGEGKEEAFVGDKA